jgi:uncharacterized surface protein with fasciclin (FAS1) repeats
MLPMRFINCPRNPPGIHISFSRNPAAQAAALFNALAAPTYKADFAPTNAAFAALPHGVLDGLRVDSDARTEVLT